MITKLGGSAPIPLGVFNGIDYKVIINAPADKKTSRRPAIPKHRNNRRRAAIICLSLNPMSGEGLEEGR